MSGSLLEEVMMMYTLIMEEYLLQRFESIEVTDMEQLFDLEKNIISKLHACRLAMHYPQNMMISINYLRYFFNVDDDSTRENRHAIEMIELLKHYHHSSEALVWQELCKLYVELSLLRTLIEMYCVDREQTVNHLWSQEEFLDFYLAQKFSFMPDDMSMPVMDYFETIRYLEDRTQPEDIAKLMNLKIDEIKDDLLRFDLGVNLFAQMQKLYSEDIHFARRDLTSLSFEQKELLFQLEVNKQKPIIFDWFRKEVCDYFPIIVRKKEHVVPDFFEKLGCSCEDIENLKKHMVDFDVQGIMVSCEVYGDKGIRFYWDPNKALALFNPSDYPDITL